jgi:ADP-ribosylglycohydrolase
MNAYERALGSLYGMATGDALGVPSSFQTMEQIRQKWGWIDDFLPPEPGHIFHDGLRAGEYTDDTEQALALISSFVRNGRVVPIDIVEEIMKWAERVKGKYASPLGPSTERALKAIRAGTPIEESGRFGTTNGSAMRISPLGIIHGLLGSDAAQMVGDVRLTCLPTHNTTVSISSTAAIAYGVAMCMHGERDLVKIIDGTKTAADLGARHGNTVSAPSVSRRIDYICGITHGNREPRKAMEEIYALFGGGDLAADSVPVAIGLFVLGKGEVKAVNEYCVNLGGDCDTNAAMAGAMAGAYGGIDSVPALWRRKLDETNHMDFDRCARDLVDLASRWKRAP